MAARFFAFHVEHSIDLQSELSRRIAENVFPAFTPEQAHLAILMDQFTSTIMRYDTFVSRYQDNIVRQREFFRAVSDFPQTEEVFRTLRSIRNQAELYKELLLQHMRASQLARDLEDLGSLTRHRLYRVVERAPHA